MSQTDDWISEHRRLAKLLEELARIVDERRIEPATMPEGVLGRFPSRAGHAPMKPG